MVVDGSHAKDPSTGRLEGKNLEDDRDRLDDKNPPNNHQEQLLLCQHRQQGKRRPERHGSCIPHKDLGGIGVEPEKSQRGPHHCTSDNGELARFPNVDDLQVTGDGNMSCHVGQHGVRARRHNHGARRQPIQSVSEVDSITAPHDDHHHQGDVHPSRIRDPPLDEGNAQPRGECVSWR